MCNYLHRSSISMQTGPRRLHSHCCSILLAKGIIRGRQSASEALALTKKPWAQLHAMWSYYKHIHTHSLQNMKYSTKLDLFINQKGKTSVFLGSFLPTMCPCGILRLPLSTIAETGGMATLSQPHVAYRMHLLLYKEYKQCKGTALTRGSA